MHPATKKFIVKAAVAVTWKVAKVALTYYLVDKYVAPVLRKAWPGEEKVGQ